MVPLLRSKCQYCDCWMRCSIRSSALKLSPKGSHDDHDLCVGLSTQSNHRLLPVRPVYTCNFCYDFQCDFLLLIDVNEWTNNECAECMLPHLNICHWCTRSHPSKGENRGESCKCMRALALNETQERSLQ